MRGTYRELCPDPGVDGGIRFNVSSLVGVPEECPVVDTCLEGD